MIEVWADRHTMSSDTLYQLCNRYHWFNGGSNEQYRKLFELNRDGASLEELALVIWICSPDAGRDEILTSLEKEVRIA